MTLLASICQVGVVADVVLEGVDAEVAADDVELVTELDGGRPVLAPGMLLLVVEPDVPVVERVTTWV